ncbi:MAG: hypothetical protein GWP08_17820 [Nitrospiraceae bacterium]|nr:hypothetical protein [Nitrospiraceae bacterium]
MLQIRPHQALGDETALSKVYYARLLKYVRLFGPRFEDWTGAPGCRFHKADGHEELAVCQNAAVALAYAALLQGAFDEEAAGVSRAQVAADLAGVLRYLAFTHRSNGLPTGDGASWGGQWQSAFWAAIAGHAAWVSWDMLGEEARASVLRMVIDEANRIALASPESGIAGDSKAEENAWNSEILVLAECMLPEHPNAAVWHERALVYMINSFVRESDQGDETVVDGRPARERIVCATLHEDFTIENHGRVHPDYLSCGALVLRNAMIYLAAGEPVPQSCSYNIPEVFAVAKRLFSANGSCFYVNGQDWWPHRHDVPLMFSGMMNVLAADPEAAFLERGALDFLERMHGRFDDGRAWDPREFNYANAEEELACRYAELYLLHRLYGDGPEPVSFDVFEARQAGVHRYDAGGFVTHRTPGRFASFAWKNGAMGLVFPGQRARDNTWFTSPSERGLVGRISCEGLEDTTPVVEAHRVDVTPGGFRAAARIARCEGKVEQSVAMITFPGPLVVWFERLIAREAVQVNEIATGTVPVLNEDAVPISINRRVLNHAEGRDVIRGASGDPARLLKFRSYWANIDGRMGVIGSARSMAYRDNNRYERARLEEELIANYAVNVGSFEAGDEIGRCVVILVPDERHTATSRRRFKFLQEKGPLLGLLIGRTAVGVNLGTEPVKGAIYGRSVDLQPLEVMVDSPDRRFSADVS